MSNRLGGEPRVGKVSEADMALDAVLRDRYTDGMAHLTTCDQRGRVSGTAQGCEGAHERLLRSDERTWTGNGG